MQIGGDALRFQRPGLIRSAASDDGKVRADRADRFKLFPHGSQPAQETENADAPGRSPHHVFRLLQQGIACVLRINAQHQEGQSAASAHIRLQTRRVAIRHWSLNGKCAYRATGPVASRRPAAGALAEST